MKDIKESNITCHTLPSIFPSCNEIVFILCVSLSIAVSGLLSSKCHPFYAKWCKFLKTIYVRCLFRSLMFSRTLRRSFCLRHIFSYTVFCLLLLVLAASLRFICHRCQKYQFCREILCAYIEEDGDIYELYINAESVIFICILFVDCRITSVLKGSTMQRVNERNLFGWKEERSKL